MPERLWTIAITRPVGQSRALAAGVRALPARPLVLPSSTLRALPDARIPRGADAYVFTSPAAVRFAAGFTPARGARVLCVGPSTRAALRRRGIDASSPGDRHDSEGLLALDAVRALARGDRVVIVGAPGGRDLIAARLGARGVIVAHAHVYERRLPRWTRAHLDSLAAADPRRLAWLVSSAEAVANVRALAGKDFAPLKAARAIAPSERVAQALREAGVTRIAIARSALAVDLLATLRSSIGPEP